MPDCCVLYTAVDLGGTTIATLDEARLLTRR